MGVEVAATPPNPPHAPRWRAPLLRSVVVDVCSSEGQAVMRDVGPIDLWIASGSVLCGQVGSPQHARSVLGTLASTLAQGGHIVVTGFTQSFLTPQLMRTCGLDVIRASVPSG